jgi:hypothetical protein
MAGLVLVMVRKRQSWGIVSDMVGRFSSLHFSHISQMSYCVLLAFILLFVEWGLWSSR